MPPEFLYFDLGNVLLTFSNEQRYRQMAEAAGVAPERVREIFVDGGLGVCYESGEIDEAEVYERFCAETGSRPDVRALRDASNRIFQLNVPILPVICQLARSRHRLGVLSNTNSSHWEYCRETYSILRLYFDPVVLSYEVGAMKPDRRIFEVATQSAGVAPEKIFYTDDLAENVEAAVRFGFDAVLFTDTATLVAQLQARDVRFDY